MHIGQLVANLILNAAQHGAGNAPITITVHGEADEGVRLVVHNAGEAHSSRLDAHLFNAVGPMQQITDDWLVDYNEYRPHEARGNVPPTQFMPRILKLKVSSNESSA